MVGEYVELDDFYAAIKKGTTVVSFLEMYKRISKYIHAVDLTKDRRLGHGDVKKLEDEVMPVARFVRKHADPEDQIFIVDKFSFVQ